MGSQLSFFLLLERNAIECCCSGAKIMQHSEPLTTVPFIWGCHISFADCLLSENSSFKKSLRKNYASPAETGFFHLLCKYHYVSSSTISFFFSTTWTKQHSEGIWFKCSTSHVYIYKQVLLLWFLMKRSGEISRSLQMSPKLLSQITVHAFLLWVSMGFLMPVGILIIRMSNREECGRRLRIMYYAHAISQASLSVCFCSSPVAVFIIFNKFG